MSASISNPSSSSFPARVDPAHVRPNELVESLEEPNPDLLAAIAGKYPPEADEQLRRQALDLSARLLTQQEELDQREAEVNARLAQLESRMRVMRVHDHDRHAESRATGRISSRPDIDVTAMLRETTRRWREAIYDLSTQQRGGDEESSVDSPSEPELDDPPVAKLAEDRQVQPSHDNHPSQNASTQEALDERRIALERMQDEMTKMHRDAIEMRLATEQLWARMSESASPEEVTKSVAELRNRLSNHFELENDLIGERKRELESLRIEASGKVRELRSQRERLQQWVNRQYAEIEHQAARLIAREQELDRAATEQQYRESQLNARGF